MRAGKLKGQLGDVRSTLGAERGRGTGGGLHGLGLLEPGGQGSVGEQACAEGSGIHSTNPASLQVGHRFLGEAGVLEGVLVVAEHAVHRSLIGDDAEDLLRIAAEAHEANLAGSHSLAKGRQRLVHDLLHGDKLDVVAEHDVEVVGTQAMQGHVDGLGHPACREIKVLEIVATQLGAQRVLLARHALERDTEQHLAHAPPVEGRGVDEVQAAVEGHAHAAQGLLDGDVSEFLAQRTGAKSKDWQRQSGGSEGSGLHGGDGSFRPSRSESYS